MRSGFMKSLYAVNKSAVQALQASNNSMKMFNNINRSEKMKKRGNTFWTKADKSSERFS
jgi:fructose-1,6-bisphosphatase/inositol monophosphatase family enzyme